MVTFNWTDYSEAADKNEYLEELEITPPFTSIKEIESHIFMEGDNYPLLSLLAKDQVKNKVDFIYIDPPYNTGNNFTYHDNFLSEKNDKHSKYLSFMARRLKLAHSLLAEDGCIFIAIGSESLYVLKLLCDSIFGENNFINDFMWLHGKGKKDSWSRTLQQHTLCYAKEKSKLKSFREVEFSTWAKSNPDNDPRGNWFSGSISFSEKRSNPNHKNFFTIKSPSGKIWKRQWLCSKEEMEKYLEENKIFWGKSPEYSKVPRLKIFNNSTQEIIPKNIIDCVDSTRKAQQHLDYLLAGKKIFDNPKPVELVKHFLKIAQIKKDAVVMDFFAGSGTTFEAVLQLNREDGGKRKCLLIQKAEETFSLDKNGNKIAKNTSKSAFDAGYMSISEICRARVEKNIQEYNTKIADFKLTEKAKSKSE